MTRFHGVLAVLHAPTVDGRRLGEPDVVLTRPLPLPMLLPGGELGGRVESVWVEGDLLRYTGELTPKAAVLCSPKDGWVGNLDATYGSVADGVLTGWRVMGVTLGPAATASWPEVSLTLEDCTQ